MRTKDAWSLWRDFRETPVADVKTTEEEPVHVHLELDKETENCQCSVYQNIGLNKVGGEYVGPKKLVLNTVDAQRTVCSTIWSTVLNREAAFGDSQLNS